MGKKKSKSTGASTQAKESKRTSQKPSTARTIKEPKPKKRASTPEPDAIPNVQDRKKSQYPNSHDLRIAKSEKKPVSKKKPPVENSTLAPTIDERSFKDQLRDLVSTQIVPLHLLKSLLADRDKLPPIPPKTSYKEFDNNIYALIHHRVELYAKMISLIMMGGSVPSASLLCGISRLSLIQWRRTGLADIAEGKDTYYSRFVNDLNVAVLIPSIDAETVIHRKDPLEWLRSGPGRWVHPEGTWQAPATKVAIMEPEPTVGIAEEPLNQVEEEKLALDAPTAHDLPAALQILKDVGLGHVIEEAKESLSEEKDEAHPEDAETTDGEGE